jgi:hypothetical protein
MMRKLPNIMRIESAHRDELIELAKEASLDEAEVPEDWYQIDEAVMTMVQRENYELFDFFYGDYEGIISNYLKPLHSWWLINSNIQKCLKTGSELAGKIIQKIGARLN